MSEFFEEKGGSEDKSFIPPDYSELTEEELPFDADLSGDDEDLDAVQEAADVLRKEGAEIILLSFEPVETSSSKVRRMDPKECAEQGMISDVVADYIIKRKLYQK